MNWWHLVAWLAVIFAAGAVSASETKDPLNYPLKQWALVLGLALFGGLASWWTKVKRGEVAFWNLQALIGELTVAAFVGVIAFFGCEWMNFAPVLTAAVVGVAGHMGTRGMVLIERIAERRLNRSFGMDERNVGLAVEFR